MKKLMYFLILLIPFTVKADYGIENYKIDITVLENGNLNIQEAFELNGHYNGFERIINYRENYQNYSGTNMSSTGNNDIYNATGINLKEIRGIDNISTSFDGFKNGDLFTQVKTASTGEYGVYTKMINNNGEVYKIYNPNKNFYIEYELEDSVIIHDDIAEVGLNIFTELTESIKNLQIYIHVPNNEDIIRIWAHGPLYGKSEIIDKQNLLISINGLDKNEPIDIRFVFDRNIVSANKKTNVNALDKIIEIETKLANEANVKREYIQRQVKIANTVCMLYLVILIIYTYYVYIKHDKEYKREFQGEYYRDIPCEYEPATVGYLMHKQITSNDLSAGILNLIHNKKITFQPLDDKGKDYLLIKNQIINLTAAEKSLMEFIFGFDNQISLKELKKRSGLNYEKFLMNYDNWKKNVTEEAKKENFYENKGSIKLIGVILSIIGFLIGIYFIEKTFISILLLVVSIVIIIYILVFRKRTKFGNNQYSKWNGLKKFMEDFGTMDTKDLPEIYLWEKYLVYAVSLGCADKLAKTMKIKIQEMNNNVNVGDTLFDIAYYSDLINFNAKVLSTINVSISNAHSAQIAASSTSSGGGFGGGFSGNGGGFSGGGGGSRF